MLLLVFAPMLSQQVAEAGPEEDRKDFVEYFQSRFPDEYAAWRADLLNYRPPGGECLQDVRDRILPEYGRIVDSHRGEEIAMLLHGGVNRVILADALGVSPLNLFRIDQAFGALNIIDHYVDGMTVVRLLNG